MRRRIEMLTNKQLDAMEVSAKMGNHVPVDRLVKEIKRLRRIIDRQEREAEKVANFVRSNKLCKEYLNVW